MVDLKQKISSDLEKIERQIQQTAKERDESATPMESHSDQTRQIANQLYNSLLEEKKKLLELQGQISKFNKTYSIKNLRDNSVRNYYIVPNGLGGSNLDGIYLLSNSSLLAQKIDGKEKGFEFELNGQRFVILEEGS